MTFHENGLPVQTILMKYHTLFFFKLRKISKNLSSAAVVIGALRVKMKCFLDIMSWIKNMNAEKKEKKSRILASIKDRSII